MMITKEEKDAHPPRVQAKMEITSYILKCMQKICL